MGHGAAIRHHATHAFGSASVTGLSEVDLLIPGMLVSGTGIPANTTIGYDLNHDKQRGFLVTEQGVVVIAKAELPETFSDRAKKT